MLQVKVAAGGNLQGINEETNACHGEQAAAGWFGNSSSALDTLFQPSKPNTSNAILPTDDLPTLFSKQGLAKYTDLFVRHEVDLQTFATLTEQDLREIGVPTFGARKKLLLLANSKFFLLEVKSLYQTTGMLQKCMPFVCSNAADSFFKNVHF